MNPARWHAIWSGRGPLAWLLRPIALLYAALDALRRRLYAVGFFPIQRLPVPVIVVGNVVVGGAGKTPTVIALIEHLQAAGWRPGVVSRGYGREGQDLLSVQDDTPARLAGDEPTLIRQRTGVPVFVSPRRVDAARALLAAHPQVNLLLCDDGLQHLALGRDLAIAVFDERGTGNGWQLPAGLLREPWPPAPRSPFRPDLLLHQRRDDDTSARALSVPADLPLFRAQRQLADHAHNAQGQRLPLAALAGRPLIAVAGIARPEVFFDMLRARGLQLARTVALPDHARTADYATLGTGTGDVLVCTEKDAVKLFALPAAGHEAWAVPLTMTPEPAFWSALDAGLAQRVAPR
jgi:tetraacyldisaccharide 4'-kinase